MGEKGSGCGQLSAWFATLMLCISLTFDDLLNAYPRLAEQLGTWSLLVAP